MTSQTHSGRLSTVRENVEERVQFFEGGKENKLCVVLHYNQYFWNMDIELMICDK